MKKRSIFTLLFCGLFFCGYSPTNTPLLNATDTEAGCEAPPPGYLNATGITPTSVTLAWGPTFSVPSVNFQVDGFDNTNSTPLPTVYTSSWTHTYTGLTPGHNYTFSVRASYCENGPYGAPVYTNTNTGIIIVDLVIGIQECSPNTSRIITPGEPFNIGVQSSSTAPPQTLTNAYTAEFYYNGKYFKFSLGFVPSTSTVYKEIEQGSDQLFSFISQNNGAAAACTYNSTVPIFTVSYINSRGSTASMVGLQMNFNESVSNFKFCGNYLPQSLAGSDALMPEEAEAPAAEGRVTGVDYQAYTISPNPFSTGVQFRYKLDAAGPVKVALYDATGRLVAQPESTPFKEPGQYETYIDGTLLPAGVYFLRLQTGETYQNHTLIKQE